MRYNVKKGFIIDIVEELMKKDREKTFTKCYYMIGTKITNALVFYTFLVEYL
jgi:hypothetical protein